MRAKDEICNSAGRAVKAVAAPEAVAVAEATAQRARWAPQAAATGGARSGEEEGEGGGE